MKDENNLFPNFASTLRKWAPGFALAILTVILMIFFKSQRGSVTGLIEKGKDELAKLYSQDLQPLVGESPISSEDVFNFALYRNLPISWERNKILQIDADSNGQQYFEIKPATMSENTQNLPKFKSYLGLDSKESENLDTLLNSYKYDIYASILTKKGNTLAVDPNIINLHSALMADITKFAQSKDKRKAEKLIPIDFAMANNADLDRLVEDVRNTQPSEFIFFTPDSIFNLAYVVDKDKVIRDIKDHDLAIEEKRSEPGPYFVEMSKPLVSPEIKRSPVEFTWDENKVKIFPGITEIHHANAPELQELSDKLGKVTFKFSSDMMDVAKVAGEMAVLVSMSELEDSFNIQLGDDFRFEFNLEELEDNIEEIADEIENFDTKDWEEFGQKMAELYGEYSETLSDSLSSEEFDKVRTEMKELKKEMKLVKEEIVKKRKLSKPIRKK